MRTVRILLLAGIFIPFSSAGRAAEKSASPEQAARDLAVSSNAFAFDFYKRMAVESGNLVVSPYSISSALAMTWAGAGGETAVQMAQVLRLRGTAGSVCEQYLALNDSFVAANHTEGIELEIAQSLWPRKGSGLLLDYTEAMQNYFNAAVTPLDYAGDPDAARETINRWVEKQTRDRIKGLLPPRSVQPDMRLVLVNAVYFKGKWMHAFSPEHTRPAPFRTLAGESVTIPMMCLSREKFPYAQVDDVQVLELPYTGGQLSLVVVLPPTAEKLLEIEKEMTPARLQAWCRNLKEEKVIVALPRFKIERTLEAAGLLKELGMLQAFEAGKADFSRMTSGGGLFLGGVIHRSFIEVNEKGTEAAAATATLLVEGVSHSPEFIVDHPFLFFLRDRETGLILFMGRVADPSR